MTQHVASRTCDAVPDGYRIEETKDRHAVAIWEAYRGATHFGTFYDRHLAVARCRHDHRNKTAAREPTP